MHPDLGPLALPAKKRAAMDVDVYLLAGQSNAGGTSDFETAAPGTRDGNRYENVRYFSQRRVTDGGYRFFYERFEPVHEGLGSNVTRIGPELGMARVLDPLYGASGRIAVIVKVAAGGTSLLLHEPLESCVISDPDDVGRFHRAGSWYPLPVEGEYLQPTGLLTRELETCSEKAYRALKELGFRSVRFAALCWMQGESDRDQADEYARLFPVFCERIRRHLAAVSGEEQSRTPVIVGEISETFENLSEPNMALNRAFLAMQRKLPESVPALTVIPTSGFRLNVPGEHGESVHIGIDGCHWNYTDMLAIGELFGKAAYERSHE